MELCAAKCAFPEHPGISDQADNTVSELTSADLAQAVWYATLVAIEALREV